MALRSGQGRRQRGVSLIEAIVAMGVMAFGMLAVVGLQATLRANGDIAKQRAQAVRIAQESIERWRAFTTMSVANGVTAYADLVSDGPSAVPDPPPPAPPYNASYVRTRVVTDLGSPPVKTLSVTVSWIDRAGSQQQVQLNSTVAGIVPELAGTLTVPGAGVPQRQPLGRSSAIPVLAKDLGDGRSGYVPPQPPGGTVAWVFNNTTGLIVGICQNSGVASSALLTVAIANTCAATNAQLLSGYISFARAGLQPDPNPATSPPLDGPPLDLDISLNGIASAAGAVTWSCFDDSQAVVAAAVPGSVSAISYFCAIASPDGKWSVRSRLAPLGWQIAANGLANFKVCRYTPVSGCDPAVNAAIWGTPGAVAVCAAPNPPTPSRPMSNADHPLNYDSVSTALTNQNFLVISAANAANPSLNCPSDLSYLSTNTRLHQDGSVNNP